MLIQQADNNLPRIQPLTRYYGSGPMVLYTFELEVSGKQLTSIVPCLVNLTPGKLYPMTVRATFTCSVEVIFCLNPSSSLT